MDAAEAENTGAIKDIHQPNAKGAIKVLVVEDEAALAELIQRALDMHKLECEVTSMPDQALAWLDRDKNFRFLLTDLNLSQDYSGLNLITEARDRNPNIQCIIMSGDVSGIDPIAFDPPLKVLQKPFSLQALVEMVGTVSSQ